MTVADSQASGKVAVGALPPVRVLAIGAHPDDVELLCAGTLAHYVSQGARVIIAILAQGDLGARGLSRAEAARVRRSEAEHAASSLGAELVWMGQPDGFVFDTPETRMLATDLFRRTRPDIVFAHHPDDYHPDHRIASQLASVARLYAPLPALESAHPPMTRVPSLFFMDTIMGLGASEPDLWVDVTATMGYKDAMLAQHASQSDPKQVSSGFDLRGSMHEHAARRGKQIDVAYAEAFFCAATYPTSAICDLTPAGSDFCIPVHVRTSR